MLLITDNHDRQGLVIEETPAPDAEWLEIQNIKPSTNGKWYTVYPLSGGAITVNAADMRNISIASDQHIEMALKNANLSAREKLIDKLTKN